MSKNADSEKEFASDRQIVVALEQTNRIADEGGDRDPAWRQSIRINEE